MKQQIGSGKYEKQRRKGPQKRKPTQIKRKAERQLKRQLKKQAHVNHFKRLAMAKKGIKLDEDDYRPTKEKKHNEKKEKKQNKRKMESEDDSDDYDQDLDLKTLGNIKHRGVCPAQDSIFGVIIFEFFFSIFKI